MPADNISKTLYADSGNQTGPWPIRSISGKKFVKKRTCTTKLSCASTCSQSLIILIQHSNIRSVSDSAITLPHMLRMREHDLLSSKETLNKEVSQ